MESVKFKFIQLFFIFWKGLDSQHSSSPIQLILISWFAILGGRVPFDLFTSHTVLNLNFFFLLKPKTETAEQVADVAPVAAAESTSVEEPVAVAAEVSSEETAAPVKVFLGLISQSLLWCQQKMGPVVAHNFLVFIFISFLCV